MRVPVAPVVTHIVLIEKRNPLVPISSVDHGHWPQAFFYLLPLHLLQMFRFVPLRRARGASNAFSISSSQKLKISLCSCSRLGTERLVDERFRLSLFSFASLLRLFRFQSAEHCLLMTLHSTPPWDSSAAVDMNGVELLIHSNFANKMKVALHYLHWWNSWWVVWKCKLTNYFHDGSNKKRATILRSLLFAEDFLSFDSRLISLDYWAAAATVMRLRLRSPRRIDSNLTIPSVKANKVSSLPRPTLTPGITEVPRWRIRMEPAVTLSPP